MTCSSKQCYVKVTIFTLFSLKSTYKWLVLFKNKKYFINFKCKYFYILFIVSVNYRMYWSLHRKILKKRSKNIWVFFQFIIEIIYLCILLQRNLCTLLLYNSRSWQETSVTISLLFNLDVKWSQWWVEKSSLCVFCSVLDTVPAVVDVKV